MRGRLAVLASLLASLRCAGALPHISFLQPEHGDDGGRFDLFIVGRDFGFLNHEVKVFVNFKKVEDVEVQLGWERLRVPMPACDRCGVVPVTVKVGDHMSNSVNFTYLSALAVGEEQAGVASPAAHPPSSRAQTSARARCCRPTSRSSRGSSPARKTAQVRAE